MNKNSEFKEYIVNDALHHLENIRIKAMFGGYGIYWHDVFVAIIAENELYTKVTPKLKEKYRQQGLHPFCYEQGNHGFTEMNYINVPQEILDEPQLIKERFHEAYQIAVASKKTR